MISGKYWDESEFLNEVFDSCYISSQEEKKFKMFTVERSFKSCLNRKISEWTWIKEERENIIEEMLEKFRQMEGG